MRKAFLSGRVFWLQPDQIEERGQGKNSFYHAIRHVLLSSHAFQPKKRGSNLPTDDAKLPQKSDMTQHPSLHRRRGHHHKKRRIVDQ
jgi:hypothetical protein